ncbi:MAG: preprotein translocase subunit SecA [Candidatus Levybacteria bacterium RIFCSPHIGHO2_01_FULL_40_15b]|nr:MAG: preprotein translocase subunit SecA [Candidatus Levybacteria bacterium RIFCSPHIGHO2_01_FULL_40_15b]
MLNILSKFFDSNDREVKKLLPIVDEINALESRVKKLKDSDFPKKTEDLKKRVEKGESIFLVLPEAFALAREAALRTTGLRPYDVQLVAATVLSQGKVAEQKTGEGKTLSAVPALYLNALSGNTVHLVTVNDYLARRDAGWMGVIFDFLGMSVSSIISDASFIYDPKYVDESAQDFRLIHLRSISRKEAYQANIVYGINSEFGFDYLRDNMVFDSSQLVQTGHSYAIIDEVDSVLVDEARTPHIISMPDATPSQKYYEYAKIVDKLNRDIDYKVDEKTRTAHLTDHGIEKVEKLYGIRDIYEKDFDTVYHIEAALKANTLFHKNKDYIVRDNQVILVDEFTGRLLEGRRLSEGLHQAIEAKEEVSIQQESKTLATVSLQNYFRMYERIAGMTGTAVTEAEEFQKIYKLDVVVVPTHKDMIREDLGDQIYKTIRAKVAAVVREIEEAHKKGQPVLVGTTSIDKNEIISEYLKRKGIRHEVLNAKNHTREAMIIQNAGKKGAVTVATNMAGRGVDIILGGQPPLKFDVLHQGRAGEKKFREDTEKWQKEHNEVVSSGGLYLIGTEKHESRRIDNQLRGRSGRQGDPGKSMFIVSLEDDLMRVFGGEQISNLMTRFNFPEDQPLAHGLVSRVIEQAQVKVEGFNFEARKHLLDYDDVLNKQREIIYKMRQGIVRNEGDIVQTVLDKVKSVIVNLVQFNLSSEAQVDGRKTIIEEFVTIVPFDEHSQEHLYKQIQQYQTPEQVSDFLIGIVKQLALKWEEQFGCDHLAHAYKIVSLSTIDNLWMDHLTSMEDLRTGIGLRGYGQRDPLIEYKNESFQMFERLIVQIDDGIAHRAFRINIGEVPPPAVRVNISENTPESEVGESQKTEDRRQKADAGKQKTEDGLNNDSNKNKLGRNDPCPCGAINPETNRPYKYKKCGMINAPYHKG